MKKSYQLISSLRKSLLILPLLVIGTTGAAQPCNGRYDDANTLIQQAYERYGALYSGGVAWNMQADVGPTLEIYRLLMGLPDSGMATPRDYDAPFIDPPPPSPPYGEPDLTFVNETLERSLARIHDPDFRRDGPDGSTDTEVLLNGLTTIGPYPGWWISPNAPLLTDVEWVIATHAQDDALDWLLTVQAASARPHTVSWGLQNGWRDGRFRASHGMLVHTLARYQKTKSLPWMVAALLTREDYYSERYLTEFQERTLNAITTRWARLEEPVKNCSASAAEYVAFSIGAYEKIRSTRDLNYWTSEQRAHFLPDILRRMAAIHLAKIKMGNRFSRYQHYHDFDPDMLRDLAGDPRFSSWLNVGLSYQARSIDELVEINSGVALEPRTIRFLNILSAEDLLVFARSRQEFADEYRQILTVAFLRLFALGRDDAAAELISEVIALWPDQEDALTDAWSRNGTIGYRLAQVALALPESRTLLVPKPKDWGEQAEDLLQYDYGLGYWQKTRRSRDLPIAIRTGQFVLRDFKVWLGTRGHSIWNLIDDRLYNLRKLSSPVATIAVPPVFSQIFAGWDELSHLGPETGLANRIAKELIHNARDRSSGLWGGLFADKDALAADMEIVIRQARRMISGQIDGRPVGQVAFEILHRNFSDTEEAERTSYWYICRERCEP